MKFAFVLDTSPLMQIKKSVVRESSHERQRHKLEAATTGMSFFEQSIYAIEEFVAMRKKLGPIWKQDKYILALTASNPESNAALEYEVLSEADQAEQYESAALYETIQKGNVHETKILSNVWHPFRHFQAQLQNLKNPRRHSKIKRTLMDILKEINAKRFFLGADNRLQGIQLSRLDPCAVILFTAAPKMSSATLNQFTQASKRYGAPDIFEEIFRWDQHLHTFCFRESLRNGRKVPNPALLELCRITGGSYTTVDNFGQLKMAIERLASSSTSIVSIKFNGRLVQCFYNTASKVKRLTGAQIRSQQGMQPLDKAHRTNLEEPELKIIHKDKWPIPLASTMQMRMPPQKAGLVDISSSRAPGGKMSAKPLFKKEGAVADRTLEEEKSSWEQPSVFFGESVPSLLVAPEPINFSLENCQYEAVEVRDFAYVYDFCEKFLYKQEGSEVKERYLTEDLSNLGWPVSMDGEFRNSYFALLRPVRNQTSSMSTLSKREIFEQTAGFHSPHSQSLPFDLVLCVMPLDFVAFWKLIWGRKSLNQIKASKQTQSVIAFTGAPSAADVSMLEAFKWKLSFDSYRDRLPLFYNDYINSYLKFLQMEQAFFLPGSERQLFEQNRQLAHAVKELRMRQHHTDQRHEVVFREMKDAHLHDCFTMPKCCSNIQKKPLASVIKQVKAESDMFFRDPHQLALKSEQAGQVESIDKHCCIGLNSSGLASLRKNLSRINSLTLTGNSGLQFELSKDPTELIGAIFRQLKRIKIEKYEPIAVMGGQQAFSTTSQQVSKVARSSTLSSENQTASLHRALQEQHCLPIQRMGDIESYLRQKYDLEVDDGQSGDRPQPGQGGMSTGNLHYLRDPALDDYQNMLLHRPYCGNPFIAPGTLGAKARRQQRCDVADEMSFIGEGEEETMMVNQASPQRAPMPAYEQDARTPACQTASKDSSAASSPNLDPEKQPAKESSPPNTPSKVKARRQKKQAQKELMKKTETQLAVADRNAEMVITRHRALKSKPGDLKEMAKLTVKRARQALQLDALAAVPAEDFCETVSLIQEMLVCHELSPKLQERLETKFDALQRSTLKELRLYIMDFDVNHDDLRAKPLLALIDARMALQ